MNIRKTIHDILTTYGHYVVYVRRDTRFRCPCYIERSGEATVDCPLCFGTSYHVEISKLRTRRTISSVPETLIGVNKMMQAGRVAPTAYVYYFEHHTNPVENDLILEVVWDETGKPIRITNKLLVSAIDPLLGYKGRIEFYQVYGRFDLKGGHDDDTLYQHHLPPVSDDLL